MIQLHAVIRQESTLYVERTMHVSPSRLLTPHAIFTFHSRLHSVVSVFHPNQVDERAVDTLLTELRHHPTAEVELLE